MISNLRLQNFQGFEARNEVELKPLTLIFGSNASGKSSILRSMLLFKQSQIRQTLINPLPRTSGFVFEGDEVSLANFANVIHGHNENATMSLGVTITELREEGLRLSKESLDSLIRKIDVDFEANSRYAPSKLRFVFTFRDAQEELLLEFTANPQGYSASGKNLLLLNKVFASLKNLESKRQDFSYDELGQIYPKQAPTEHHWTSQLSELNFTLRGLMPLVTGSSSTSPGADETVLRTVQRLLNFTGQQLSNQFEGEHIGPLRPIRNRLNYSGVGGSVYKSETPNPKKEALDEKRRRIASKWLLNLTEDRYEFKRIEFVADEVRFLGNMHSDVVLDRATNTVVTLSDVGVGLSQVIPILEALANSAIGRKPGSILTIEQPELHLHPKMQGDLADLFIDASRHGKMNLIAETHSEAILLRVIRRLREGSLEPDKVAVIFVENDMATKSNIACNMALDPDKDFRVDFPLSFSSIRLDDSLA